MGWGFRLPETITNTRCEKVFFTVGVTLCEKWATVALVLILIAYDEMHRRGTLLTSSFRCAQSFRHASPFATSHFC